MEALPRVITKLGELLVGEYNLQKGVKGEIVFLQAELESMKGALEKVSSKPVDQLDIQDRIWAKDLRELSYDIEDQLDIFMVRGKGNDSVKLHGIKKFMERSVGLFRKAKIRHGIATEIRDIKSRVVEVHERRRRYDVNLGVDKPAIATVVDPRLFSQYREAKDLVGIDETRDELISILMGESGVPLQQGKTLSIVGFGGLGKTTIAKAVYEKIGGQFDCCAFVSVSQTPDFKKIFKGILYELGKHINEESLDEWQFIDVVREFLKTKRYLIVIDDVWDISVWKVIKCALPDNDVGYIVITTTRNVDVAEEAGSAYKLKPLSEINSRILLYRRVFGNKNNDNVEDKDKCPDKELEEVSQRMLKKCAGVPLAIITMASLLACRLRNKMDWYEVYHSIGTGLEHNIDVENMRKILSFSYYDMPSHLRTCLLYLSMFPEDYKVDKDDLIWMWIGEGFIQCEKQGQSLFEIGEIYFNELINRSMIQPAYLFYDDDLFGCQVHDMVLDLIRSLSCEANFVTILNGKDQTSPLCKIRRLSIQKGNEQDPMTIAQRSLQHVRSIIVHQRISGMILVLPSFQVLRVMDLKGCDLSHGYNLNKCLGNLFHLRYLGLYETRIVELPGEIGNLQFLQTLKLWQNKILCLPSNVIQLKDLMYLQIENSTRVPNGIGSLRNLEVLKDLSIDDSNIDNLEQLGQLTELRTLRFSLDKWNGKLVECLNKLQKIQEILIWIPHRQADDEMNIGGLDAWVPPRHLRCSSTRRVGWFSMLPAWMNPSHLPGISFLNIAVREVQQGDLVILGSLHALRHLELTVGHEDLGMQDGFVVGAGSFKSLTLCRFAGFVRPVLFQQGAMPRLRHLYTEFSVRGGIEVASSDDGVGLDLGLGHLPSLQQIEILLYSKDASKEDIMKFKDMLWDACEIRLHHLNIIIDDDDLSEDDGLNGKLITVEYIDDATLLKLLGKTGSPGDASIGE